MTVKALQLVLASASPYRRELLRRLGLDFSVAAVQVDESLQNGERPEQAVVRLARAKAHAGARLHREATILASDQLAGLGERALGKPGNHVTALAQLTKMSGQTVTYYTALALVAPGDDTATFLDISHVRLRVLGSEEIERYLAAEKPLDCAGALKLESRGIALCERIDTADPTALIGLPLIATARLLRERGFTIP